MIRNKSIIPLIIIMIISPIYLPFTVSAESWWNNSWSYKIKITVNQIKIDADLTDFPVMVYLNSSRIDWTHVQDNLDDLRFLDSTETVMLKVELEKYVINDEAWIWVKVPIIDDAVNTNFYMYYGNSSASSSWDTENVWETSAVMIQHMMDATTSTILDSTDNDNDGAKTAANEPIETGLGKINSAQSFDSINDHILTSPSPNPLTALTVEAWINPDIVNDWKQASVVAKFEASKYQWKIGLNDIGMLRFDVFESQISALNPTGGTIAAGILSQIVGTFDGQTAKIYLNGEYLGGLSFGAPTTIQNVDPVLRIGYESHNGRYFDGVIDEVRVYNVAQSAEWIKADYNSGTDTLLIYGGEIFQLSLVDVVYPQSFSFEGLISIISIILIIGVIIYRR